MESTMQIADVNKAYNGEASGEFFHTDNKVQREIVIDKLRKMGCRITKQRLLLLDIILGEECSSCKEIYYKASRIDKKIGSATVYRMVNTLEDIGAINRKNMYKVACGAGCEVENACVIAFDDQSFIELSASEWSRVLKAGLKSLDYIGGQNITSVVVQPCTCHKAC